MSKPQSTPRVTTHHDGSFEVSNLDHHSRVKFYNRRDIPTFTMFIRSPKSVPLFRALITTTGKVQGVFAILANEIQYGTYTEVTFEAMAELLHTTPTAIYHHLHSLKVIDLVRKAGKDQYLMNPHILWRGHTVDRAEAITRWDNGTTEAA